MTLQKFPILFAAHSRNKFCSWPFYCFSYYRILLY